MANRLVFDRFLHDALSAEEEGSFPVSLILIDVDYFMRYNDKYGHVMGECLKDHISKKARKFYQVPAFKLPSLV